MNLYLPSGKYCLIRALGLAVVVGLSWPVGGQGRRTPPVAFVQRVEGDWSLNGSPTKIKVGQNLRAGDLVTWNGAGKNSGGRSGSLRVRSPEIFITFLCEAQPISRSCESLEQCRDPISIADACRPQSIWVKGARVLSRILPARYSTLINAGSRGGQLPDGVVKLEGGQVDLSRWLSGVEPGKHRLRFHPLPIEGRKAGLEAGLEVTIKDRGQSIIVPRESLEPGLFLVTAGDQEAWVMVTPAAQFTAASDFFAEAVRFVTNWREPVNGADRRIYLRTWLYYLATPNR
ncbi:MAG TPA: hypothetical protein VJ302_21980 [Blastocatellia bacterium]|nr:hypothetical protein [Blastocatellia bacterium]